MALAEEEYVWKDRKHWLWFPFSFTKYRVGKERLYIEKGLLKTTFDETLLYRITDVRLVRTLGQKICGTGTLLLYTRVDNQRTISLKNIKHPKEVNRMLSDMVEEIRDKRNIVGKEFYGIMGHPHAMGDDNADFDDAPDFPEDDA